MNKISSNLNIYDLVGYFLLIIFILFLSNYLYATSVDFAHHYALVTNLSKYFVVNNQYGNLGEMSYYPPLSHYISMIVGSLFNSNLIGIVSYFSVTLIWIILARIILDTSGFMPFIIMTLLILFGVFTNFFNAFLGFEIIGNFFFSQIVGHAIMFCIIYIIYISDKNVQYNIKTRILLLSSIVLPYVHLLPTLQVFIFISLLLFFDFYKNKKINYLQLFMIILSVIILLIHPKFRAMKSLAAHNGALSFPIEMNNLTISILIISIFVTSLFLIYLSFLEKIKENDRYVFKFISILGISVTFMILLQFILLQCGEGSEYAVKKHIFSVFTILILELSILIAYSITCLMRYEFLILSMKIRFLISVIFAIIIMILITGVWIIQPTILVKDVLSTEKKLEKIIKDTDKNNKIYLDEMPLLSYLFTISVLEHPRNMIAHDLLYLKNSFRSIEQKPTILLTKQTIQQSNRTADLSIYDLNKTKILMKIDDFNFVEYGNATFNKNKYFVSSNDLTDAGYVSQELHLQAGLYKLQILLDIDVSSQNINNHAAHISIYGSRILQPIFNHREFNQDLNIFFWSNGEPLKLSFGLGGWGKGLGFIQLKEISLMRVTSE